MNIPLNNPWEGTQAQYTKSVRELDSVWEENPGVSVQKHLLADNLHVLNLNSTRQSLQ